MSNPAFLPVPKRIRVIRSKKGTPTQLGSAFFSEDTAQRRRAFLSINEAAKEYGDELAGFGMAPEMALSSFSDVPSRDGQNTPGTLVFGDTSREIVDIRWTAMFNVRDNRGLPNDSFLIEDVYNAVVYEELKSGSPIKLGHVESGRARFEYRILAGGLQFEAYWAEDYPYWTIEQAAAAMITKYALRQERIAIETVTAAGALTASFQATDVATINEGQRKILEAMYTANRPDGEDVEQRIARPVFFLIYNEHGSAMTHRVNAALSAGFGVPNDVLGGVQVNHPVIPIPSPHVTGTDWHLVLPGMKNVFALKNDLRVFNHFDPFQAGGVEARAGHGRFGMVRGDANQVCTVATS